MNILVSTVIRMLMRKKRRMDAFVTTKQGEKKIHYNVLLVKSNVMKFKFLLD